MAIFETIAWAGRRTKKCDSLIFASVLVTILTLCLVVPAFAVQPDEVLGDPALEARARGLSAELRCLVCQNQSIDDSNAPLAKDLRVLVRERLAAGDSDRQAIAYITARYGEFVLLRPRLGLHTLLLWATPLAVLLGTGYALWRRTRRASTTARPPDAGLTPAEQARLDALLKRTEA